MRKITVVCPGTSACTLVANHSIQVLGPSGSGNSFQIDFAVDGKFVQLAQEVGEVPTDSSFRVFSAMEVLSGLAPGSHTIQTGVWSLDGTAVYNCQTSYQVFKP